MNACDECVCVLGCSVPLYISGHSAVRLKLIPIESARMTQCTDLDGRAQDLITFAPVKVVLRTPQSSAERVAYLSVYAPRNEYEFEKKSAMKLSTTSPTITTPPTTPTPTLSNPASGDCTGNAETAAKDVKLGANVPIMAIKHGDQSQRSSGSTSSCDAILGLPGMRELGLEFCAADPPYVIFRH
jgi:hypothetical protein